jgi:hypothetical protein
MAKEGLYLIVSAQENEEGRIVVAKEKGAQLYAHAHFPEIGRMQLSDTQAGMLPRVG